MVSLTCFNRHFTPNWRMALLAFLAIVFFTRLGFWQMARADEKKHLLAMQSQFAKQAPLYWQVTKKMPKQYQQLQVKGEYLPQILLVDNQFYQHTFGYHVLSPLSLSADQVVLIDRGWVAGDKTRQSLPAISRPVGSVHLTGYAYYPSAKTWVLGQAYEQKKEDVIILERIDAKLVSQFLHKSVYPFIIRLGKENANGYIREWPVVAMPPERHYAYALQWFAIALVILILFIGLNLKKKHENI